MQTITIHVSDETTAALELYAARCGRVIAAQRASLRAAELSHNVHCEDPDCPSHQAIAEARQAIDQIEMVDCFMSDVVSALKCAAKSKA